MKIEEIKKLCGESISADEYFSCGDFRKALFIALEALEEVSEIEHLQDGGKTFRSLKEIEELFE